MAERRQNMSARTTLPYGISGSSMRTASVIRPSPPESPSFHNDYASLPASRRASHSSLDSNAVPSLVSEHNSGSDYDYVSFGSDHTPTAYVPHFAGTNPALAGPSGSPPNALSVAAGEESLMSDNVTHVAAHTAGAQIPYQIGGGLYSTVPNALDFAHGTELLTDFTTSANNTAAADKYAADLEVDGNDTTHVVTTDNARTARSSKRGAAMQMWLEDSSDYL